MGRAYNVIDADGHVLEPVDIWDKYIDPSYRERAPRMIVDTDGIALWRKDLASNGIAEGRDLVLFDERGTGSSQATVSSVHLREVTALPTKVVRHFNSELARREEVRPRARKAVRRKAA